MSSFTAIRDVRWMEHFYLQCSSMPSCVMFFFFFTNFFSNATDNEHCQLVEILIERSVFGFNIQKKVF